MEPRGSKILAPCLETWDYHVEAHRLSQRDSFLKNAPLLYHRLLLFRNSLFAQKWGGVAKPYALRPNAFVGCLRVSLLLILCR